MNPTFNPGILSEPDRMDSGTRLALEQLRRAHITGHVRDIDHADHAFRRQMRFEARAAGLDPVAAILADPVKRTAWNALCKTLCEKPLSPEEREVLQHLTKALGGESSPGSTLLVDELRSDLFDLLERNGAWGTLGVRPMATQGTAIPILTARPVAKVQIEGVPFSDDASIAGTSTSKNARLIGFLLYISKKFLEDQGEPAEDLLRAWEEAVNGRFDYIAFSGNGVEDADNGGYVGIFDTASGVAVAAANIGNTTIANLEKADFDRTIGTVDAAALQRSCSWWLNPAHLYKFLSLRDGSGAPLLKSVLDAGGETLWSLNGYPVRLTTAAPSTDAASSRIAAFGHGPSYAVGVRKDFNFAFSEHFRWTYNQSTLRAYARATFAMRRAGGFAILSTAAA